MERSLDCLRCRVPLEAIGEQPFPAYYPESRFQLQVKHIANAFVCPSCGMLEFYTPVRSGGAPAGSA